MRDIEGPGWASMSAFLLAASLSGISTMGNRLEWVETEFSPAEFARASGLNGEMQRHWRRRGLLPERTGRIATFTAREIATVRLMMLLGQPQQTRGVAERLASHVISFALGNHPESWIVEGPQPEAKLYRHELEMGHAHIDLMAGIKMRELKRYVIISDRDEPVLVSALHDDMLAEGVEIWTAIDLGAIAAKIAQALDGRPIMTVRLPKDKRSKPRA